MPKNSSITYTGSNALEVVAWAEEHDLGFVVDRARWPSVAGKPLYFDDKEGGTSIRLDPGDNLEDSGLHRCVNHNKPEPERDDQLRRLALEQAVLFTKDSSNYPADLWAEKFYTFLKGEEQQR